MNPCLRIPEIVLQVVQHVTSDTTRAAATTTRADLARLARTSRLFSHFALEQLWADERFLKQRDRILINLLRCFPPDLVTLTKTDKGVREVRQLRPFILSDLDRPARYFQLIRKFYHEPTDTKRLETSILMLFATWLPWDCMFPALEQLRWTIPFSWDRVNTGDTPEVVLLLRVLLSPKLRSLSLCGIDKGTLSILPLIAARKLPLQHLTLHTKRDADLFPVESLATFLCTIDPLEKLDIAPSLHRHVFRNPESLANLVELRVTGGTDTPPSDTAFPALRRCVWSETNLTDAPRFLRAIHTSALELLSFEPELPVATTTLVSHLFSALDALETARSSLRSFAIRNSNYELLSRWEWDCPWQIDPTALSHLGNFPGLTNVTLIAPGGFGALDDAAVTGLLQQLPCLQQLCLTQPNLTAGSQLTLRLLSVAARHTCLQHLELTMDDSAGPPAGPVVPSKSVLTTLGVGYTGIAHTDPAPMAHLLAMLFPVVRHIKHQWMDDREYLDNDGLLFNIAFDEADHFAERWNAVLSLVERRQIRISEQ
ncbi:hypothetical protein MIND_01248000 [Mycena indigotica]|uniref:F-box domain-containing protein n=1 Tax=Mycena indigotica TaxID=2126181 RepID=A0A8H6S4C9_9AGAR|nr:uncharacterized protein MIND_01248000 [Mycena indigotica]KAF7292207.1 hypothetical protein MIND_01248000 [Mycena indigotica]